VTQLFPREGEEKKRGDNCIEGEKGKKKKKLASLKKIGND